jgi:glucuronate isomerase
MPGKMQFGSGWWFNDQKDGMERQMTQLAQLGLLSRFVGMLTTAAVSSPIPAMNISAAFCAR